MDAVHFEHRFAEVLGIEPGQRGEINDADRVRSCKPEDLAEVLSAAAAAFRQRLETYPNQHPIPDYLIGELEAVAKALRDGRHKELLYVHSMWAFQQLQQL